MKYVSGTGACRSRKTPVGSLRHLPGRQGRIFENSWPNEGHGWGRQEHMDGRGAAEGLTGQGRCDDRLQSALAVLISSACGALMVWRRRSKQTLWLEKCQVSTGSSVSALTLWSRGHTNCVGEQLPPLDETLRRPRDGGVAQLLLAQWNNVCQTSIGPAMAMSALMPPFFRGIIQTCPCSASHLRSVSWMYCITRNRCGQEGVSDGDELIPGKAKL